MRLSLIAVCLFATVGCLDLSTEGKWFPVEDGGQLDGGDKTDGSVGAGCQCALPSATCEGSARVSASSARCLEDGGCAFTLERTACPLGCKDGLCEGSPCLGVTCDAAPAATCVSETQLRAYTNPGSCNAGSCLYSSVDISCACRDGRCQTDRCAGISCNKPPLSSCLNSTTLRSYVSAGTCDAQSGMCSYEAREISCAGGCANGECLLDKCAGVSCNTPPAAVCISSSTLRTYAASGTCAPGNGLCSYTSTDKTCAAGCSNGACLSTKCVGVVCQSPPAATCVDATTLRSFVSPGVCSPDTGNCGYAPVDTSCGAAGCSQGRCQANACANVTCNSPPASTCLSSTQVKRYTTPGTCASGACSYASTTETCVSGKQCQNGACVATNVAVVWTARSSTGPAGRTEAVMAFDEIADELVMFGGYDGTAGAFSNETWTYTTTWTRRTPAAAPSARSRPAMTFDGAKEETLLFGGKTSSGTYLNDTWLWDGTTWRQASPTNKPPARSNASLAYDTVRARVVLFGGVNSSGPLNDTWEWDGSGWTQRTPAQAPSARSEHAMAYDSARQRIVLFGGKDGAGELSSTWLYDGTSWTSVSLSSPPPARARHTLAYDENRQRVVMFGGYGSGSGYLSDTWEWDGTRWTANSAVNRPPVRDNHAMAYDSARNRVVVFGGFNSTSNFLADTWTLGP